MQQRNEEEARILADTMSVPNSVKGIIETEKSMKTVVECISDAKKSQRKEVISKGSNEFAKLKRWRKGPNSNTTERTSTVLKVEPEKGKKQKQKKRVPAQPV